PAHHYTAALLASIPEPDPEAPAVGNEPVRGELPSPIDPPSGCRFRTRCARAEERCVAEEPQMQMVGPGHYVACHFPLPRPVAGPVANGAATGASVGPPAGAATP
ncbi:MAG TPA: oligopeptide/dipeptide ABC transporter ATP-binding protein, partial [Acidimicrobiales bacterium]|nr:oligopeptide/dipeptide ABC transporter ATP-binding protein [Acidimicrobiales bacterium]